MTDLPRMRRKPKRKPPLLRRLLRIFLWTFGTTIALSVLVVAALRVIPPPTSAFMVERRIAALVEGDEDFRLRYRWTPWNEISRQLPISLVAAEDQKFPTHHGFDVAAIQDALADANDGERLRGASTISQQTAKNLFLWGGRSFVRKGLEAYFTTLIELLWPKRRILEVYCNIAEFGDGVYGAAAASEHFFGVSPARLTPHQSALLAAALPNPRRLRVDRPSSYMQGRAAWIMRQARQLGGPHYLPPP
jgi:monofunctional biosynthetic peptidoglycan transglycosylase